MMMVMMTRTMMMIIMIQNVSWGQVIVYVTTWSSNDIASLQMSSASCQNITNFPWNVIENKFLRKYLNLNPKLSTNISQKFIFILQKWF